MKNLSIILLTAFLFSCNETDEMGDQYYNLYAGVVFSVSNSQGEDLLNPETPDHIHAEDIRIYYVVDGETQEVYNPTADYPRNFIIDKDEVENEYRIGITLNHTETSDKPITYIQWSKDEADMDTIEVVYNRTQRSLTQNKIWLNGEFIWEIGDNTVDPYFELIK